MNTSCKRWSGAIALVALLGFSGAIHAEKLKANGTVTNPFAGRDDMVPAGRTLFNVHCSHCHGPNAVQGERPRDLRRLSRRYGDEMPAVFYKTVTVGRVTKGMPPWKGILEDDAFWKIFTFLETVQKQ